MPTTNGHIVFYIQHLKLKCISHDYIQGSINNGMNDLQQKQNLSVDVSFRTNINPTPTLLLDNSV